MKQVICIKHLKRNQKQTEGSTKQNNKQFKLLIIH